MVPFSGTATGLNSVVRVFDVDVSHNVELCGGYALRVAQKGRCRTSMTFDDITFFRNRFSKIRAHLGMPNEQGYTILSQDASWPSCVSYRGRRIVVQTLMASYII